MMWLDHPLTSLHHTTDVFQQRDVIERVAFHDDEIGMGSRGQRSDPVLPPHQLGGPTCSALDGLGRAQSVIDVIGRLLSVVAVGIDAGVGSVGDLHTGPERFGESDPLRTWRVMNAHHGWSSSALPWCRRWDSNPHATEDTAF